MQPYFIGIITSSAWNLIALVLAISASHSKTTPAKSYWEKVSVDWFPFKYIIRIVLFHSFDYVRQPNFSHCEESVVRVGMKWQMGEFAWRIVQSNS